ACAALRPACRARARTAWLPSERPRGARTPGVAFRSRRSLRPKGRRTGSVVSSRSFRGSWRSGESRSLGLGCCWANAAWPRRTATSSPDPRVHHCSSLFRLRSLWRSSRFPTARACGLYLDAQWEPTWPAEMVAWPDFGLPDEPEVAARQIAAAFRRAQDGELVEVGCLGGSGRTGTVLACMAVLAGVPPDEAVAW